MRIQPIQEEKTSLALGIDIMWEDENCPLTTTFMDDMAALGTIIDKGSNIRIPWLLIHGTEDDVVLPNDSNDIFTVANEPKQLHLIGGADHSFNNPAHCAEMVATVIKWIQSQ